MNNRVYKRHQLTGFTLVEVMVALLIVAFAISALLFQMSSNIDNTAYLRDKTIAHWVALNQLELAYLENQSTNKLFSDQRSGSEKMAGRDWYWRMTPIKTANDKMQQLEVAVSDREDSDSPVLTVMGIIDQFHTP
ncbi:MAG: general secretion pathway protein I [Oceanicoccus sp.]|jgi:general secretion pathway protein I